MATSLTLTQKQKLQVKLSPAQIQVMRMLELPACELQARINEELQDNPALDEGRDQTLDNEGIDNSTLDAIPLLRLITIYSQLAAADR